MGTETKIAYICSPAISLCNTTPYKPVSVYSSRVTFQAYIVIIIIGVSLLLYKPIKVPCFRVILHEYIIVIIIGLLILIYLLRNILKKYLF